MADSGSTGRVGRRALLRTAVLAPLAVVLRPQEAAATDYASAGAAFAAIDALEAEVVLRLRGLEQSGAAARAFATSLKGDHEAHGREREGLRARLGLGARGASKPTVDDALDLEALRAAQEKLTYAHAEALPALADAQAVQVLARHLVDLSRHLALVGLWIEAEERRG